MNGNSFLIVLAQSLYLKSEDKAVKGVRDCVLDFNQGGSSVADPG